MLNKVNVLSQLWLIRCCIVSPVCAVCDIITHVCKDFLSPLRVHVIIHAFIVFWSLLYPFHFFLLCLSLPPFPPILSSWALDRGSQGNILLSPYCKVNWSSMVITNLFILILIIPGKKHNCNVLKQICFWWNFVLIQGIVTSIHGFLNSTLNKQNRIH